MQYTTLILRLTFIAIGIFLNLGIYDTLHSFQENYQLSINFATIYLAIYVGYALFMLSPIGDKWLNLGIGSRKPTTKEQSRLSALETNLRRTSSTKRIGYPDKLEIRVLTDPYPNAIAFGRQSIALTTGLLKGLDDEAVKGVMAHEIGHIAHKDTLGDLLVSISFGPALWVGIFIWFLFGVIGLFGLIPAILLWPATFCVLINLAYLFLKSLLSRSEEFAADAYAVDISGEDGLKSFLEQIEHLDTAPNGKFLAAYTASHPPTAVRIDRIENPST